MTVLVVDWLGRGGIAQTAETWCEVLKARSIDSRLVSRPGREVRVDIPAASVSTGRLRQHRAVVRAGCSAIREHRPTTVVVHSWLIPPLELPLYRAARSVGAKVVVVAHNHRSHTRRTGMNVGLGTVFDRADAVVTHSRFVRDNLPAPVRAKVLVVPLPKPLGILRSVEPHVVQQDRVEPLAVQFGVKRGTKDTTLVTEIDRILRGQWTFAVAGTMADDLRPTPRVDVVPGFVEGRVLTELIAGAQAVLLPYSAATQSAAVVLARCLGTVPIASAVGGIPEQVRHGTDGLLVPAGASAREWADALKELSDRRVADQMISAGRDRMEGEHLRFERMVTELVGSGADGPTRSLRDHPRGAGREQQLA